LQKGWIYTKRCDILLDKERDDMKKAIYISILCTVMLTACGNVSESVESAEISAVNQTTVTVTSVKEEKDTSETATTTRKSSQTVSETSLAKTTTKSMQPPQEQIKQQSYPQTAKPQENTEVDTTQIPAVTTTQQKQTATAPPKPSTATQKPQTTTAKQSTTEPQNTMQWSEPMKAWRKLCEGKSLSDDEQNLIRSEILEYAKSFNGKRDIHVSFGIDEYDIFYEKPLDLTVRNDMTDLSYAHMDAYADADSRWLIDHAGNEGEIYSIVSETREKCLHVIDYELFNRWEIYSGNNVLKYASDIEFNVGFDGTAIWFLTED
jgi:hypothetical protein